MKNLLSLLVLILVISCTSPEHEYETIALESTHFTRSGQLQEISIKFQRQDIIIDSNDIFTMENSANEGNEDAQELMNFRDSLLAAEKEVQLLDVNFVMSEDTVVNGIFIFGIETENSKDLAIEMFDEEGFGMVANNNLFIVEGNNYKALNVNSIESGEYIFRLKDQQGRELERVINIEHK